MVTGQSCECARFGSYTAALAHLGSQSLAVMMTGSLGITTLLQLPVECHDGIHFHMMAFNACIKMHPCTHERQGGSTAEAQLPI